MQLRTHIRIAIFACLPVLVILITLRLIWKVPKPLLLFLAASYAVTALVFWLRHRQTTSVKPGRIAVSLIAWLTISVAFLALVFKVDRAGWLWFRLTGFDTMLAESYPQWEKASAEEFVRRFSMFELGEEQIILRKGVYEFDETVVVPEGTRLVIEAGTVLRFGAGRSLISYSPIEARGTAEEPIVFTALNPWFKWGVVGVVKTGKSVFEHVRFQHPRSALVNGVRFNGGLSVIESDVEIRHSRFLDAFGKDAVNVQRGHVLIQYNLFRNAYKDGLDLDGGSGEVSYNEFINCDDEGIDLSDNLNLRVFANKVFDRRGGRIGAEANLSEIVSLNTLGYQQDN